MIRYLARRTAELLLTLVVASFLVFAVCEFSPGNVARKTLGAFALPQQVELLYQKLHLNDPLMVRYARWAGVLLGLQKDPLQDPSLGLGFADPRGARYFGNFGYSTMLKEPVNDVLWDRLGNTAILAGIAFALIVPLSMLLGVFAGIWPGSYVDRTISVVSIVFTSTPEYALGVILVAVLAVGLHLFPGTSPLDPSAGWSIPAQLVLPVMVLTLYDAGYVARIVRSSMTEVMATPYIRTAILKGLPRRTVIARHALRNAMIAPFTVMLLQINWLIGGVVVTELVFAYPGFRAFAAASFAVRRHFADRSGDLGGAADRLVHTACQRYRLSHPRSAREGTVTEAPSVRLDEVTALSIAEIATRVEPAEAERRAPGLLRRLPTSGVAMAGLSLVLLWVVLALLAPVLPLPDPNAQNYAAMASPGPSAAHWLGIDPLGRDILSRLIWGSRIVLVLAPVSVLVAYAVGCALGLLAGYYRGWVDPLISRASDVILSFPVVVLYVILIANIGPSALNIIVAVILSSAPGIGRIARGLTLTIVNQDYIAAARLRRERAPIIMLVEILPNCRGPLITDFCLRLGYTTIMIGTLGFLGLGLPPPNPDWGGMVQQATPMITVYPLMAVLPCIAIVTLVLGFNLLADGLNELSQQD